MLSSSIKLKENIYSTFRPRLVLVCFASYSQNTQTQRPTQRPTHQRKSRADVTSQSKITEFFSSHPSTQIDPTVDDQRFVAVDENACDRPMIITGAESLPTAQQIYYLYRHDMSRFQLAACFRNTNKSLASFQIQLETTSN